MFSSLKINRTEHLMILWLIHNNTENLKEDITRKLSTDNEVIQQ